MKLIRKTVSGAMKACRMKALVTVFALCAVASQATAQTVDGRNFGIDGFAALPGKAGTPHYLAGGTTGGECGKVVYARTFQQLKAYLQAESPYIVLVDKDMDTGIKCWVDDLATGELCAKQDGSEGVETTYGERIMIASNKTLIGVTNPQTGEAPLFSRISFVMQCANNVIIRNCRFTMNGVPADKADEMKVIALRDGVQTKVGDPDCISIQADETDADTDFGGHIWIDHCEFFNGNAADKDRYDGLVDCKNNVQWITVSYNHFHNHDKVSVWGKSGNDVFDECRTTSFHHNFYENIEGSRLPLQRGGYTHYCNNYHSGCQDGWELEAGATGFVEACYFYDTKAPIKLDSKADGYLTVNTDEGYDLIYESCRRFLKGYKNIDNDKNDETYDYSETDWSPYDYEGYTVNTLDKTADVPAVVQKYAGAGKIEIWSEYADAVPAEDINEYAAAIKDNPTEATYDENGDKITEVTTGITQAVAGETVATQYYSLDGVRLAAPAKGVSIKRSVDADGNVTTVKVVTK